MSDPDDSRETAGPKVRLFCALDPPPDTVALIERWQREQAAEGLRAVGASAMHVTLAFLGERPESQVAEIAAAVEGLRPPPIAARLGGEPVPLPRRRPRLFALEVASEEAVALQAQLAGRLRCRGLLGPEPERPFWPHLTVFRVRGRRTGERIHRLKRLEDEDGHAFGFVRVALYRSDLRPEGASYSRLAANELPQAGG